MTPLRILLVDDEPPARARLRRLLASAPDIEIVGEADSGPAAVAAIESSVPDLILLDIQMPGLSGFEVLAELAPERTPRVVFVTAFDAYALEAFRVHALDYLLKPVDPVHLLEAIERARASVRADRPEDLAIRIDQLAESLHRRPKFLKRLLVHHENKAFLVPLERIDRIEADRNVVLLHSAGGPYRFRSSIGDLVERLDPARFLRINRSEIVRLDAVKEFHPWSHGDYRVLLHDGTELTWSRRYRARTEDQFGG
ncbi:MAG: LytTR family DNA-binding domain-containing protein [Gemmatimonadota bacterium]